MTPIAEATSSIANPLFILALSLLSGGALIGTALCFFDSPSKKRKAVGCALAVLTIGFMALLWTFSAPTWESRSAAKDSIAEQVRDAGFEPRKIVLKDGPVFVERGESRVPCVLEYSKQGTLSMSGVEARWQLFCDVD